MLDRPHLAVLVDLEPMRQAKRQLAEFDNAVLAGKYEDFMGDIRSAARECLIRASNISPREREVLHGIATAHPIKVVAGDLGLSEVTVKVHIRDIKAKLSAATGTRVDNTTKMVLLYWGISAAALQDERDRATPTKKLARYGNGMRQKVAQHG